MSNYLFIFGVNGFNVGERLCYNRSSSLCLPFIFCICPSFSSMTSSTFYDLLSLTHAYNFHMLTISHVNDFTCLRLSHVNRIHMLLLYLFCMTTLYYMYKPLCNVLNSSLVFIVNLSCYRLSPLDGLTDNSLLYFFCH